MEQKAHQPVTTASDLLRSLDGARASRGVSKAELARRSHVRAETVRRLLTDEAANPSLTNVLDMLRPLGLGLGLVELPRPVEPTDDMLCAWLSFYGAALYGSARVDPSSVPDVETVLADSLKLSRQKAVVARALPLAFWKSRQQLNMDRLRREAECRGQTRVLGFFLDLTAKLSGETTFESEATKLHVRVPTKPTQFFQPATWRERKLAEMRTPEVARKWGFRMNMDMDSFESMFRKGTQ
jgi:transcriptional regulator with XRE-family HTH domain